MTRKHFIAIAEEIKDLDVPEATRQLVAKRMATVLDRFNPYFDRSRFIAACGAEVTV